MRSARAVGADRALAWYREAMRLWRRGPGTFALLALVCTARVIPAFLKCGERAQALLAALQVLVLLAAALHLFPGAH